MLLSEIIIQKIRNDGPISFRDYMDMCLYYPSLGYYTSGGDKIGRQGDFYTSASLSKAFGAMIARQIEEMWHLMGDEDFTILEYGAGTGQLCYDILDFLERNERLSDHLHYAIIEKSPEMIQCQKKYLGNNVTWYDSIEEVPQFKGCILSNELIDNFPVHRVYMDGELLEVIVDYQDGFVETFIPAGEELKNYLSELEVELPYGFCTEINLVATEWIKGLSRRLDAGFVITIDYGLSSEQLYSMQRSKGTLRCYYKHAVNTDPYAHIGEQDITAHVNYSALRHWGLKNGLECCGMTNQAGFLLSLGYKNYVRNMVPSAGDIIAATRHEALVSHKLLVDMGEKYQVLLQKKGLPACSLSGLKQ